MLFKIFNILHFFAIKFVLRHCFFLYTNQINELETLGSDIASRWTSKPFYEHLLLKI